MASFVPTQIQAGVANTFSLSAWIDSTIQHRIQTAYLQEQNEKELLAQVPWMQSPQNTPLTVSKRQNRRETAVYTARGSRTVNFAYCGCADHASPTCQTNCTKSGEWSKAYSKTKSESQRISSGTTLVDFDMSEDSGVPSTPPGQVTLRALPRSFYLPAQPVVPSSPKLVAPFSPTGLWFDDHERRSCSLDKLGPILNANLASAPLCCGKATVVQVTPNASPELGSTTIPSVKIARLNNETKNAVSSPGSGQSTLPEGVVLERMMRYYTSAPSPTVQPRIIGDMNSTANGIDNTPETPPESARGLTSPLWVPTRHKTVTPAVLPPSHTHIPSIKGSLSPSDIVSDIKTAINQFPTKLLSLCTPCVLSIRRKQAQETTISAQSRSLPTSPETINCQFDLACSSNSYSHARRTTRIQAHALQAPRFLRTGPSTLDSKVYNPHKVLSVSTENLLSQEPEPKTPSLEAINEIFLDSDVYWQSTLYSYILVYNYLCGLQTQQTRVGRPVAPKAARTMGIPAFAMISDADDGDREDKKEVEGLVGELERCMVRIMKLMMGKGGALTELSSSESMLGREELALVRSLGVIVKMGV